MTIRAFRNGEPSLAFPGQWKRWKRPYLARAELRISIDVTHVHQTFPDVSHLDEKEDMHWRPQVGTNGGTR